MSTQVAQNTNMLNIKHNGETYTLGVRVLDIESVFELHIHAVLNEHLTIRTHVVDYMHTNRTTTFKNAQDNMRLAFAEMVEDAARAGWIVDGTTGEPLNDILDALDMELAKYIL